MPIDVHRFVTAEQLGTALAAHLAASIDSASGRACLLGWPAGRTPRVVVDGLVALGRGGRLDLRHTVLVLMDEFLVTSGERWSPVRSEAHFSCRGFVARELARVNVVLPLQRQLPAESVWSPDPTDPGGYDERIAAAGGIDVFVVASGSSDGHVAFNPPGSDPGGGTRIVALAETTRRDNLRTFPAFRSVDDVPTHGVSVGLGTIAAARELAVVTHGAEKRRAAAALLGGTRFRADWPATVALEHPHATLWVDDAAADAPEPMAGGRQ